MDNSGAFVFKKIIFYTLLIFNKNEKDSLTPHHALFGR